MKKNTGKEEKEVAVIPKKELVLEGDPEAQLAFAMKAANALMKAIAHKPKPVMIRGEQYLEYGDWQTLARFFGATAAVEWTRPIVDGPKTLGYEARATVLHQGQVISSAEAMCMRSEANWRSRDEFMLRSMAQTRASAKALRNAYGWVAELAGMKATPAEEMDSVEKDRMPSYQVARIVPDEPDEAQGQRTERVIQTEPKYAHKKVEYPKADDTNDAAPLFTPKEKIKTLIKDLGDIPTPRAVKKHTGLDFVESNYEKIVEALENELKLNEFDKGIEDAMK